MTMMHFLKVRAENLIFFAMSANLGPAGYTYFLQTLPAFWYLKKKKAEAANLSKSSMRMLTRTTLPYHQNMFKRLIRDKMIMFIVPEELALGLLNLGGNFYKK